MTARCLSECVSCYADYDPAEPPATSTECPSCGGWRVWWESRKAEAEAEAA